MLLVRYKGDIMEIKRKQNVLRNKFWFRIAICLLAFTTSIIYLFLNNDSHFWSVIIGVSGSALVWALVELVDFFIQTQYRYESERNTFLGIITDSFCKMKSIIRASDDEIPMHELKSITLNLYEEINNFLFNNDIYPVSKEFESCCNYIERMRWKFDACCAGIYDDCEERNECYQKLYDAILLVKKEKELTSKRFFECFSSQKSEWEMTNIELSFEKYTLPEGLIDHEAEGNIKDSFMIPGNIHETITFVPDIDFKNIFHNDKSNILIVFELLFRTI